jgi:hypothetical protein
MMLAAPQLATPLSLHFVPKPLSASIAAEKVGLAVVVRLGFGCRRIDFHTTYRVS